MPEYEYHGLMSTYWDLLRGDTSRWADCFMWLMVKPEDILFTQVGIK